MKRNTISEISLDPDQRSALWAALELLLFLSGPAGDQYETASITALCDVFDSLDGNPVSATFRFTPDQHYMCRSALNFAMLYLSGCRHLFDGPVPVFTDSTLRDLSSVVIQLASRFAD